MNVRRSAAVLAAAALFATGAAPAASGDTAPSAQPSATLPAGLYGRADPTYDGTFRQSYALLAQHTAGVRPAASAVGWLTGQQCADGGFAAFRAEPRRACDGKTPVDSNSTAAAVQALAALGGHGAVVGKAVDWLRSVQNGDGGWGYTPGLASDANSTGIVIGALVAAGEKPGATRSAKGARSPYDALPALALPCSKGGAFGLRDAKSGKLGAGSGNPDATAAAVLGGLGQGAVPDPAPAASGEAACRDGDAADLRRATGNGVHYLLGAFTDGGYLESSLPGADDQPDYGNTADAVVALAAAGRADGAAAALARLKRSGPGWARKTGPAAWAQLVFAAHATGTDPRHFGTTDLVAALNATGPAPVRARPAGGPEAAGRADEGPSTVWWVVGACLAVLAAAGLTLGLRARRRS